MKTTAVVTALVMIMAASMLFVTDGSDAVEESDIVVEATISIDSEEDLADAVNNYSSQMSEGHAFRFELNTDIDISNMEWNGSPASNAHLFPTFCGVFDGNNHTIRGSLPYGGYYYLINTTTGNTILSNLVLDTDGSPFSLANSVEGDSALIDNITVNGFAYAVNNDLPFVLFPGAKETTFRNCVNNADWDVQTYSGVFMAFPLTSGIKITFENCVNNGTITGQDVAVFVGNSHNSDYAEYKIINSYNSSEGQIIGTRTASLFSTYSPTKEYTQLNETYSEQCNQGVISTTTLDVDDFTTTVDSNGIINVNGSNTEATDYDVQLSAYARWIDGNVTGTLLLYATGDPIQIGEESGMYNASFIDFDSALALGWDIEESQLTKTGMGYVYGYIKIGDAGHYVFKATGYDSLSVNSPSSVNVRFYDATGARIGSASPSLVAQSVPEPMYNAFYTNDESYTIVPSEGSSRFQDSFMFSVQITEGYIGELTVQWYPWDSPENAQILSPSEDVYTINYVGNIVIYVSGLYKSNPSIHYNTGDAQLSNMPDSVSYGSSFTTTISVPDGYVIDWINVTMGAQSIQPVGNTITIDSVTDEVFVTVHTSYVATEPEPVIPGENDEDEYVPPSYVIPEQPSNDDDTVTIVACAAAAAVAAILAVFLILDRKR